MNDNDVQLLKDQGQMDYYNTCRDDEDKCPECGIELVEVHEPPTNGKGYNIFHCLQCGYTESGTT